MSLTIQELANVCDAITIQGNAQTVITGVADIKGANNQQLTVLSDTRYAQYLPDCQAAACIVKENVLPESIPPTLTLLVCSDPEISFINSFADEESKGAIVKLVSTLKSCPVP